MKNRILFLFICIILPSQIIAQIAPDTLWTRTFGSNFRENANCIQITSDNGFIIAGNSNMQSSGNYYDASLLKLDENGIEQWTQIYGGYLHESASSVQQTTDGGYIIAEIFPTLFKQLYLGTVIGMPTSGSVIGTGHYTFMDGSSMRMPSTGWFTPTGKNMEGNGAIHDIFVDPTPEQVINNDDVQLKRAVEELLKTL